MFKKIEIWIVLLILLFFFIGTILFGTLILYHHAGGDKFPKIQRLAVFLAEIPYVVKKKLYTQYSLLKKIIIYQDLKGLLKQKETPY